MSRRRMILVRYDVFPYMLVHKAHKLPDRTYRWVSSFDAGHQRFGTLVAGCESILDIMSAEKGEPLKEALNVLEREYDVARKALEGGFLALRAKLLADHKIKAEMLKGEGG